MSDRNGRTRIQFTRQEIEAMRTLVIDRLRGEVTSKLRDETLGGIVVKVARASKRLKPVG
ncbi:hypothetical protein ES708_03964 [subsurface metagenome]